MNGKESQETLKSALEQADALAAEINAVHEPPVPAEDESDEDE